MPEFAEEILSRAEAAKRDGNPLAVHDLALSAIEAGHVHPRFRYLQVLASAQMGDTERAEALYDAYRLGVRSDDEDGLALRGRLHKDLALAADDGAERHRQFKAASAAYLRAYAVRSGYFPAINAATTAWAAGDRAAGEALALTVLAHPDLNPPRDFFAAASRAEALVLLGRGQEALAAIAQALATARVGYGERASACHQLEWLCASTSLSKDDVAAILAALRPPPVLTYTGHMFRPGDGKSALAARISAEIGALGSTIAYGALACGSDILIAEEILRRGGELQVVLPFGAEDFLRASVLPGGDAWVRRFEACLAKASSVTLATRMEFIGDDLIFAYGARLAGGLARLRARQIATSATQLAVWDGQGARGDSGAAVDVATWRGLGFESRVIDPGPIDRTMARSPASPDIAACKRLTRAIIFTDYKGYSKLPESTIPVFNREVMGRIARVLDHHAAFICARNTWGDAFHGVVEDTVAAAEITLEIVELLGGVRIGGPDSAGQEGMRIGLHFGPVFEEIDPVTGLNNFYGSEVTLAARIEPTVIPGEIYATQAFAAILAMTAPGRFSTPYLGKLELAKGHGALPIYRLERRAGVDLRQRHHLLPRR